MLRSLNEMTGYKIQAIDGGIGKVKDFLFDDRLWIIRYLEADTGPWLFGRKVLISPVHFASGVAQADKFVVDLTCEQVDNSPELETDKPVSRQYESVFHSYYSLSPYWTGYPFTFGEAPVLDYEQEIESERKNTDQNLRSCKEVTGYHIKAKNQSIGHIDDLITDEEDWSIRYAVIATKDFLPGRKVLIAPQWIEAISWPKKEVYVDLDAEQIKESPEYNPSEPVNREYEVNLYDFYGRPAYWTNKKS